MIDRRNSVLGNSMLHLSIVAAVLLAACAAPQPAEQPQQAEVSLAPVAPLRPPVMGRNAGVSAGHPLTTSAAMEILQQGGNAFDAGVAALLVGGVVEQHRWYLDFPARLSVELD